VTASYGGLNDAGLAAARRTVRSVRRMHSFLLCPTVAMADCRMCFCVRIWVERVAA
jgi:hypothetical protein